MRELMSPHLHTPRKGNLMSANVKRMAYTGEAPWWIGLKGEDRGQGMHLGADRVTASEMISKSGLDYEVGKSPLFVYPSKEALHEGKRTMVPGLFGMIRNDTMAPLPGVAVGDGYTPIQNRDVFDVLDQITGEGGVAHYETAGELNTGTVWMLLALDHEKYVAGDKLKTYLVATTKHDGTSALRIKTCMTRVVCANTVAVMLGEATPNVAIRHTSNYKAKLEDAKRILGTVKAYDAAFDEFASQMLATKIPQASSTQRAFLDHLFPVKADMTPRMLANVNDERGKFARALYVEDLINVRETAWGLLQATADYAQHRRAIRSSDSDTQLARLFERSFEDHSLVSLATQFLVTV